MRILKIVSLLSYLSITGLQEHSIPMVGAIVYYWVNLFSNIQYRIPISDPSWESVIVIPLTIVLLIFFFSRSYKNRYLAVFCFITLVIFALYLSGLVNYFENLNAYFLIPFLIFLASSILALKIQFKSISNTEPEVM